MGDAGSFRHNCLFFKNKFRHVDFGIAFCVQRRTRTNAGGCRFQYRYGSSGGNSLGHPGSRFCHRHLKAP